MISSSAKLPVSRMVRPYRLRAPSHTRISTIKQKTVRSTSITFTATQRGFSQSARALYPRKDSQHKDSINTEATEYSKSASDDEGARQQDAAFDPNVTDPQEQMDIAGKGTEGKVSNRVHAPSTLPYSDLGPTPGNTKIHYLYLLAFSPYELATPIL